MSAHEIIIMIDYISLTVMAVVSTVICFHVESYMQKFASYAAIILAFCSVGFLFKAEADNVETLIFGQRIVYCMIPHATFAMLLFILAYCKAEVPKWANYLCSTANLLISFMAMTIPYNQLFYKKYWAVEADGYLLLEKEYAFGHTFALAVLLLYMFATIVITIIYTVKNLKKHSRNVWKLLLIVLIPYSSYILPKLLDTENELQPLTFAIFIVLILIMIYKDNLYDVDNLLTRYALSSVDDALVVFNKEGLFRGCNQLAMKLFPALSKAGIETDITKELPVFRVILDGGLKEYRNGDQIYSITAKDILENEKPAGMAVWFENVTLQHDYTELLKKQNANLETEVNELIDKSHRDEMTGLYNRRSYEEQLDEIRQSDNAENVLIGCFDVNGLKKINDSVGHSVGDELICGCAHILEDLFGNEGRAYRIGGDEFCVILTNPLKVTNHYINSLEQEMQNRHGELVGRFSMSYGFAYGKDHPGKSVVDLFRIADQEMYEYKKLYHQKNDR